MVVWNEIEIVIRRIYLQKYMIIGGFNTITNFDEKFGGLRAYS